MKKQLAHIAIGVIVTASASSAGATVEAPLSLRSKIPDVCEGERVGVRGFLATVDDDTIPKLDSVAVPVGPLRLEQSGFFASPTGALLKSVAVPGWGQWSNGKKKKAAVYAGIETYFIIKSLIWRHRARESGISFATFDHARGRRNFFYWWTGATIFVSMFDAYADRHLLILEQTRGRGDDYWGGQAAGLTEPDGLRLSLTLRF